jgi:hypothetical protein
MNFVQQTGIRKSAESDVHKKNDAAIVIITEGTAMNLKQVSAIIILRMAHQ